MEKYMYLYRDKVMQSFSCPVFQDMDSEHFKETVARSCKLVKPEEYAEVKDKSLYFIGSFDDITGKFSLLEEPVKLLDLEDYVPSREEILEDVRKHKNK